jgi:hypothetical protein
VYALFSFPMLLLYRLGQEVHGQVPYCWRSDRVSLNKHLGCLNFMRFSLNRNAPATGVTVDCHSFSQIFTLFDEYFICFIHNLWYLTCIESQI